MSILSKIKGKILGNKESGVGRLAKVKDGLLSKLEDLQFKIAESTSKQKKLSKILKEISERKEQLTSKAKKFIENNDEIGAKTALRKRNESVAREPIIKDDLNQEIETCNQLKSLYFKIESKLKEVEAVINEFKSCKDEALKSNNKKFDFNMEELMSLDGLIESVSSELRKNQLNKDFNADSEKEILKASTIDEQENDLDEQIEDLKKDI